MRGPLDDYDNSIVEKHGMTVVDPGGPGVRTSPFVVKYFDKFVQNLDKKWVNNSLEPL